MRLRSNQVVDGLTAATLYFDVFTGPETVLLDFLEQPAATTAANLYPTNTAAVLRCNLARREHATSK
jgi:hypothetical protein